ncbi:hypothetical protein GW756_05820 [bacterium]|nr:hypothetical protein [bacterium]NCQ55937.1 hypothetical protein [Candidatus Parcubacteria bacterium]NCS67962.1 hypothetical protein [Candidatus Peregrinibacteria bacterium]NCS96856.1 hypothetical protein [bacterium]
MSISPNRAPESIEAASGDEARTIFSRMFNYERPRPAANDNPLDTVVNLNQRREALDSSRVEGTWLQRNVTDLFMNRTETRSELYSHSAEIGNDLTSVRADVGELAETWNDDRQLKRRIDQYERYNRRYGDQARHVVESQIEGLDDSETPELEIDENSTPEEIAAFEEQQTENRLREEALERWNQFAVQSEPGGSWRSRKLFESALGWENIKDSWQNRTSMWGFFKNLGADYAQWKAVKSAIPAVNVVSYGVREGRETIEQYREVGETVAEGVETVGEARRTQREVRREGAEAVVLASETARSGYIQEQMRRLMRGEVSREQVLRNTRTAFRNFERQDPQEFARMIRGYGLTARSLNTKAGFYELFKNAALWYTPWGDRGERSFWEANETAVPVWGSYAAWRDINVDNGLPLWSRIGFATVGTALDIGTVLSLGTLSPVVAGAKVAMVKGSQALGRRVAQRGATRAAVGATSQAGSRTLAQVMGGLPRAAREAVTGAGARGVAMGAAGYTALSAGIDWLFDLEDRAVDLAFAAAEEALGQEFSYQQRRLLRVVGEDIEPVIRDAYDDYREDEAEVDLAETTEGPVEEITADESQELTDGQIADVSTSDEERAAA